jgi:hypothetical protein
MLRRLRPLALLLVVLLAPAASAQNPLLQPGFTFHLDGVPASPVKPQVENPMFSAIVVVRCDVVLEGVNPAAPMDPVPVADVVFQAQSGVLITGASTIAVDPALCTTPPATEATVRQPYQISIPRSAPGLQAIPAIVQVSGHPPSAPGIPASPEQQIPFTITADYYSVNQVAVEHKVQQCRQTCAYELEVTNFGNARTLYRFEIVDGPEGGNWNAIPPEALLLDSPNSGQGNSTGIARFVVHPGVGDGEDSYHILIHPVSADDPSKAGNPMTVKVLAQHTGVLGIDAPAAPLVLLLLAGLAVASRRRA